MNKDEKIEKFLNKVALLSGYRLTRSQAIAKKICVQCGQKAINFKDELSKKEYTISGFCQICQDNYFE